MTVDRPAVNILHRYDAHLFTPHFDPARDGYDVIENGTPDRDWDLLLVFEALAAPVTHHVRGGRTIFVGGEPPELGGHTRAFLKQFYAVHCASAPVGVARHVSRAQHFNNWHFGWSGARGAYRLDHAAIRDLPPPVKTRTLSTVTSNLDYLPMHILRRALIDRLASDYSGRIDFFGRPHRFVEYKEDAILPYCFHLCVENSATPDLWTEKIADALLGYAVPVYAGCPNIERYFPGATIALDLTDYVAARCTIDALLNDGEAIYRSRFDALCAARQRLIGAFDMSTLVGQILRQDDAGPARPVVLRPESAFAFAQARDLLTRARRKSATLYWRRKVARHG